MKGIIVGTGRAGTYLHFGAHYYAGTSIEAFVDINLDFAKKAALTHGVANYFVTLEEALMSCPDVDFVDICTHSASHLGLIKTALEFNKHVLVEKPIVETKEELDALIELAKKHENLKICAVHNHRFYPGITAARDMITSGQIGEVISIHREMSFNFDKVRMMEQNHWSHNLPGGRLFEANPHNLYLLRSFLEEDFELEHISCDKKSGRWPHAKIDSFNAKLITINNKIPITINMSLNCTSDYYGKHGPNFFFIVGSKKSILVDYAGVTVIGEKDSTSILNRLLAFVSRKIKSKTKYNDGSGSGHKWILKEFADSIKNNEPSPVPLDESVFVQKMNLKMGQKVEEIIESSKSV